MTKISFILKTYRSWIAIFSIGILLSVACDDATEDGSTSNDTTQNTSDTSDGPTSNASDDTSSDTSDNATGDTSENSSDDSSDDTTSSSMVDNDMSRLKDLFYSDDVEFVIGENTITITSSDLPDHKSVYYDVSNDLFENYTQADDDEFVRINNLIEEQNIVLTVPRFPEEANNHEATGGGAIGIAVNSVAFYNQSAAPGDDILEELKTFDQYEGHAQQQGQYHYHTEPVWLTIAEDNNDADDERFLGLLLDGFPVYGPEENGVRITNSDLDDYHGHSHAKPEFPNGIYHYHVTDDLPWINGDGYFGTPGTKTQ